MQLSTEGVHWRHSPNAWHLCTRAAIFCSATSQVCDVWRCTNDTQHILTACSDCKTVTVEMTSLPLQNITKGNCAVLMLSNACTMCEMPVDIRGRHIHCLYFMNVAAGPDAKVYIMWLTVDKQSVQIYTANERLDSILTPWHDRYSIVAMANNIEYGRTLSGCTFFNLLWTGYCVDTDRLI